MNTNASDTYQQFLMDCEIVSNESFTLVPGMVKRSRDRIVAYLRDGVRSITTWDFTRPEVVNVAQVRSALSRAKYMDLAEFMVDTPVGFNANESEINDYINALSQVLKDLEDGFKIVTDRVSWVLGNFISDPEIFSEYPDRSHLEMFGEKENLAHLTDTSSLGIFFNEERGHLAPFTSVYASNNECVTACHTLNSLNSHRWQRLNPKEVKRHLDRINTAATSVFVVLDRQKNPNVENVKLMMNAVLFAAQWSRHYAIVSAKLIDATTALKHTEQKLLKR